ncbi:hypothetical protein [Clostridium estertheticum]|uniref:hypothetical protein n=1 Tax=Clostridium estertheticum TaxID=238834 RepID=UPI001C0C4D4D|nr:hypothetical protein [Clostridium estertheticum]MBU3172485.1 hypothetical protein [Clostridium estertheticum]
MNYKDYIMIKKGNYCSVGMFGINIYAFESITGFASMPEYIQITKDEFDNFTGNYEYGERKILCSGYKDNTYIDASIVLTDEEIEKKKKDKSLWKADVYSKEYYTGQGVVVFDYTPYKLTKRAYEDVPLDTLLLSGFKNIKMGYLWQLAYEEVKCDKHIRGTYCETIKCNVCENEFYFTNVNIPIGEKYEVQCPKCNISLKFIK